MPATGEPGKGRLIVAPDAVAGDLGSLDLKRAMPAWARALLGTEQSGLHEIASHSIFCDVFLPPPQLALCGAGDDARPLARLAAEVGFRVIVVDRRPGFLTAERFPTAAGLVESDGAGLARRAPGGLAARAPGVDPCSDRVTRSASPECCWPRVRRAVWGPGATRCCSSSKERRSCGAPRDERSRPGSRPWSWCSATSPTGPCLSWRGSP